MKIFYVCITIMALSGTAWATSDAYIEVERDLFTVGGESAKDLYESLVKQGVKIELRPELPYPPGQEPVTADGSSITVAGIVQYKNLYCQRDVISGINGERENYWCKIKLN